MIEIQILPLIFVRQKQIIMTTLTNTTGTKKVNITYNDFNGYRASFVQVYNGEQDVIEAKSFSTEKKAKTWAAKKLS